jgi:hypothetical protein
MNIIIYASHGFGSAKTDGAALNRLVAQSEGFDADVYLMGHVHRKACNDTDILKITTKQEPRLIEHKKLFGVTGTFLKCYEPGVDCYAEKGGC